MSHVMHAFSLSLITWEGDALAGFCRDSWLLTNKTLLREFDLKQALKKGFQECLEKGS